MNSNKTSKITEVFSAKVSHYMVPNEVYNKHKLQIQQITSNFMPVTCSSKKQFAAKEKTHATLTTTHHRKTCKVKSEIPLQAGAPTTRVPKSA